MRLVLAIMSSNERVHLLDRVAQLVVGVRRRELELNLQRSVGATLESAFARLRRLSE